MFPVPLSRSSPLRRRGHRDPLLVGAVIGAVLLGTVAGGAVASPASARAGGTSVSVTVGDGLLDTPTDGRVIVQLTPAGADPNNSEPDGPNQFYGINVDGLASGDTVTLTGGSNDSPDTEVYGYPTVSLDDLAPGSYRVRAFLTKYDTATRSDGSTVTLGFPCGDGAPKFGAPGSLTTGFIDVVVTGNAQDIDLDFTGAIQGAPATGDEIGGCSQGNYADTDQFKHVKIKSDALSDFWGRDMYVGANVLLPAGYDPEDTATRYPVVYVQSHWPGDGGAFGYPYWDEFSKAWNSGVIPEGQPGAGEPIPKMILVTIRHESPYYDDSYGVNSANLGPWGDAVNDELVPYIDETFNTIAAPYGRIQEGGSTGGWISLASVVFRPDLFGAAFSYYPDSLDFNQHQDIDLYGGGNAYTRPDGSKIGSIRNFDGGSENVLSTVEQENHWELAFGTSSRSNLQWDVWNAVFGVQGLNGYPLEPWNKVTGEIYPEAVDMWKPMDMSDYVSTNWSGEKDLGDALRDRLHISVGDQDNYYLDGGVIEFKKTVEALGGSDWADVTLIRGLGHGGFYNNLNIWDYLKQVRTWVDDHSPTGATPLSTSATASSGRGNEFAEVMARGGHQAALDRQSAPVATAGDLTDTDLSVSATSGTWDPGVELTAQWLVDGKPVGDPVAVDQGESVERSFVRTEAAQQVTLAVTGVKTGYTTETRTSSVIAIEALPSTTPDGDGDGSGSGGDPSTPDSTTGAASPAGKGNLASTGTDSDAVMMAAGAALLALLAGGVLVRARRRSTTPRRG